MRGLVSKCVPTYATEWARARWQPIDELSDPIHEGVALCLGQECWMRARWPSC